MENQEIEELREKIQAHRDDLLAQSGRLHVQILEIEDKKRNLDISIRALKSAYDNLGELL